MAGKKNKQRPSFEIETKLLKLQGGPVAGVDEAGRGPWAGPVVAAAVILDERNIPKGIDDSKALDPQKREILYEQISKSGAHFGIGIADILRIDRDNILNATLWAMTEAIEALPIRTKYALIDGNIAPSVNCRTQTLIKGDSKSLSIAAASILAKVTRDRIMCKYEDEYPGYGFVRHKGYGTSEHMQALKDLGITPIHRRSFKPIQQLIEDVSTLKD